MKKSPLSTPGGPPNTFYRGRGRVRGYGSNQNRNSNNFHKFPGSNGSPYDQREGNMIPLDSSSPIFHHNMGNRQQPYDRRQQRFSNTGVSGSYNNRNNFQNSPHSHFQRGQHQNNFRQRDNTPRHRKLPISEFIDLKSIYDNPWQDLEKDYADSKCNQVRNAVNDSSVEIISEKNVFRDSSFDSNSDGNTINISSSLDEVKEGSSVDLQLDQMQFSKDSKNDSAMSDTWPSEHEKTETLADDSAVEIIE